MYFLQGTFCTSKVCIDEYRMNDATDDLQMLPSTETMAERICCSEYKQANAQASERF